MHDLRKAAVHAAAAATAAAYCADMFHVMARRQRLRASFELPRSRTFITGGGVSEFLSSSTASLHISPQYIGNLACTRHTMAPWPGLTQSKVAECHRFKAVAFPF